MTGPDHQQAAQPVREPIFLVPGVIVALVGVLFAAHLGFELVLDSLGRARLWEWFGFVPFRITAPEIMPGGMAPVIWTLFTHALLHADWMHLAFNTLWLAAFGTPVARRYGPVAVLAIFFVGAAAGALSMLVFVLAGWLDFTVLVGASGGVAALTGAAARFVFQPVVVGVDPVTSERVALGRRTASLGEVFANRSSRAFVIIWVGMNLLVPLAPLVTGGQEVPIAWQAHLGGFALGLFAPSLIDRRMLRRGVSRG